MKIARSGAVRRAPECSFSQKFAQPFPKSSVWISFERLALRTGLIINPFREAPSGGRRRNPSDWLKQLNWQQAQARLIAQNSVSLVNSFYEWLWNLRLTPHLAPADLPLLIRSHNTRPVAQAERQPKSEIEIPPVNRFKRTP